MSLLSPQHRAQAYAIGQFRLEESLLEPARPAPSPARLPTDTVDLATLLCTHGHLRGESEARDMEVRMLRFSTDP